MSEDLKKENEKLRRLNHILVDLAMCYFYTYLHPDNAGIRIERANVLKIEFKKITGIDIETLW